jgi:hypothetical protein
MQANPVNNAAVLQLQVTKAQQGLLATNPKDGVAQFLTVLKPCGLILPHLHPRSTELYSIVFGAPQPFLLAPWPNQSN